MDAGRSASSAEPWQSRACLPQAGLEQAAEVIERRREQAAEVVPIPLLWRSAELQGLVIGAAEVVPIPLLWRGARQGGVVERRQKVKKSGK